MSWVETMKRSSKSFKEHLENICNEPLILFPTSNGSGGWYAKDITWKEVSEHFLKGKNIYVMDKYGSNIYPVSRVSTNSKATTINSLYFRDEGNVEFTVSESTGKVYINYPN